MAMISDFLKLWNDQGRPVQMILSAKDWTELAYSMRHDQIHIDPEGPYFSIVGCTIRPPFAASKHVDLSSERVFHADV